jgi:cytochrome P450 PksS
MLESAAETGKLDELDLFATVSVLIQGGHSTTMGLLGRGLRGLLEQREQFELLCADPDGLAASATEELLRWTSPAQRPPPRWVYEDIDLGGEVFLRGEVIEPMIASANRDETVFSDPDRIDIRRPSNPHLGFGGGVHRCVGSTLARLEGQVVFRELARRFPRLSVDVSVEPTYMDRRAVRAINSLSVVLG